MPYLLNAIYLLLSVCLLPVWMWRTIRGSHDGGGFPQRFFGIAPHPNNSGPVIWLHGASVGEILALRPLIERFKKTHSNSQLIVSAYTRDGLHVATQTWPEITAFYLPFDLSWAVRRTFRSLKPTILILSELELWPNLLLAAQCSGIPVAVVSSKINDTALAHFQRNRWLLKSALPAIRWWGVQTQPDAERVRSLPGTNKSIIEVTGSLKCDVAPTDMNGTSIAELKQQMGFESGEQILVAGSTHAPEEEIILDAFATLRKDHSHLRLILIPRHSRRCDETGHYVQSRGMSVSVRNQSSPTTQPALDVTIIQSVGELAAFWAIADFVFVGGTLTPHRGGQSMIEPALLGKPMCFGPNVWNFMPFAQELLNAGGASEVHSGQDIVETITLWSNQPLRAAATGAAAIRFAKSQQGAAEKTISALQDLIDHNSIRHQGSNSGGA